MGLLERFMGNPDPDRPFAEMVANPAIERPLSYQVLLMGPLDLDADALELALRNYHPELERARVELLALPAEEAGGTDGTIIGLVGWRNHVIKLMAFAQPIPANVFEACVRPAHFTEQLKRDAREHRSHVLLFYAGEESDPLEQYVALTVVSAGLAAFDAILILNESARSAFPAEALLVDEPEQDRLESLRQLPIPLLYGGFVKVEVEGTTGVWMRTFGNYLLRLPDLAMLAEGHHQGTLTFELFANMLAYLRESGSEFAPGHTLQVGDTIYLRLRKPAENEWFLQSEGEMLVAEAISAEEVASSRGDSGYSDPTS